MRGVRGARVGRQRGQPAAGRVRRRTHQPKDAAARVLHAVIVVPATHNTINKWAAGIADTYPPACSFPLSVLPSIGAGHNLF
ncbi:flavoprotein [Parafrankia discariae]|uniref:flavoprotein n=1 Tax=Parafrankia discariae TaxID=365528 RepID=UPI0022824643|nr:flavoprotein [Parafrankia discariae]